MTFAWFQHFEIVFTIKEDLKEKIKRATIEVAINATILLFELK